MVSLKHLEFLLQLKLKAYATLIILVFHSVDILEISIAL